MHGKVDVIAKERVLDFFDEQTFAAGLRQRFFLQTIACGLDDDEAARRAAVLGDTRRDRVGLPQRQRAAASPYSKLGNYTCHVIPLINSSTAG